MMVPRNGVWSGCLATAAWQTPDLTRPRQLQRAFRRSDGKRIAALSGAAAIVVASAARTTNPFRGLCEHTCRAPNGDHEANDERHETHTHWGISFRWAGAGAIYEPGQNRRS